MVIGKGMMKSVMPLGSIISTSNFQAPTYKKKINPDLQKYT